MRNEKDLNKEGKTALRFLIRISGEGKIVRSTGVYIEPKFWSKKMQRALGKSLETQRINKLLADKIADFNDYFMKMVAFDKRITRKLVDEYFKDKRFDDFFGFFDLFIEEKSFELEDSTMVKYNNCRTVFEEFSIAYGFPNLKFIDVNLNFLTAFDKYLIQKRKVKSGSANNYHKILKVLFKQAVLDEIIDRTPFYGFKPIKTEGNPLKATLNEEEVDLLREVEFEPDELHLEKTRDVFLFILNTGLRFSDVKGAKLSGLKTDNETGVVALEIVQKKTKNPVEIILNREARMMIHRVRRIVESDYLFGVLTLKPFNRNLKEVARIAGIEKNLSTHVGRHTLATYLFNKKGLNVDNVANLLGQKDTSVTQGYIRKYNLLLAPVMDNLYYSETSNTSAL
jgi:site-specific recombinase XerD